MLIDSHCHLDCLDLTSHHGDLEEALESAWKSGVEHILNVGVKLETFENVLRIAQNHADKISCSVGVQPSEKELTEPTVEKLIKLAREKTVIAIGETGLDYYYDFTSKELQQMRFRSHIQAALAVKKPLIIHARYADQDLIEILKTENAKDVGAVMHCFTGDWNLAKAMLDLGFYISFSGIVTFKKADELREVVKKIPLDRMLIETDAPYLAPIPFRGKPNEPAYLRYTAEFLADFLKIPLRDFAEQTTKNFRKLFILVTNHY